LGYASELGNYAEYSGAPNEDEVLQYARVVIDVRDNKFKPFLFQHLLSQLCRYSCSVTIFLDHCSVPLLTLMVAKEPFLLEEASLISPMLLLLSMVLYEH